MSLHLTKQLDAQTSGMSRVDHHTPLPPLRASNDPPGRVSVLGQSTGWLFGVTLTVVVAAEAVDTPITSAHASSASARRDPLIEPPQNCGRRRCHRPAGPEVNLFGGQARS